MSEDLPTKPEEVTPEVPEPEQQPDVAPTEPEGTEAVPEPEQQSDVAPTEPEGTEAVPEPEQQSDVAPTEPEAVPEPEQQSDVAPTEPEGTEAVPDTDDENKSDEDGVEGEVSEEVTKPSEDEANGDEANHLETSTSQNIDDPEEPNPAESPNTNPPATDIGDLPSELPEEDPQLGGQESGTEITEFDTVMPEPVDEVDNNELPKPDSGISSTEGTSGSEGNYGIVNRIPEEELQIENHPQYVNGRYMDEVRSGLRSETVSSRSTMSSGKVKMRLLRAQSQPLSISSSNGILHTSLRATPLAVKITEVDEHTGLIYGTLAHDSVFGDQPGPQTVILTDRSSMKPQHYYNGPLQQQTVPYYRNEVGVQRNEVGVMRPLFPELLPYIEDFNNIGPGPTYVRCPKCNMKTLTRVDRKPSSCAFISGFFLCLCLSCYVPFCMKRCQAVDHYCIRCQTFLGRYSRC